MSDAQEQIFLENKAAGVVVKGLSRWVYILTAIFVLSLLLNIFAIIALSRWFPIKEFIWTSDARAVCEAIPLSEPNVSEARVRNMAADAAIELNSFDYLNWRRQIQNVMNAYMTGNAQKSFSTALDESGIIKRVQDGYYIVTAMLAAQPPRISEQGRINGRYYWKVEVPLVIYYRNKESSRPESRVIEMTIVRVDPSVINPNGIAIDGVSSKQQVFYQQ